MDIKKTIIKKLEEICKKYAINAKIEIKDMTINVFFLSNSYDLGICDFIYWYGKELTNVCDIKVDINSICFMNITNFKTFYKQLCEIKINTYSD